MNLEKLQEKLEGVSDLDDPKDCKRVIEMLLRDLDRANGRIENIHTELKMLAYLVSKGKPNAVEKAESILSGVSMKAKCQVWDMLMGMSSEMSRAESFSDVELLDDVLSNIWGEFRMSSRESAILEELIRRYREKAGISDTSEEKGSKK